jgi:hypothetical protein
MKMKSRFPAAAACLFTAAANSLGSTTFSQFSCFLLLLLLMIVDGNGGRLNRRPPPPAEMHAIIRWPPASFHPFLLLFAFRLCSQFSGFINSSRAQTNKRAIKSAGAAAQRG